MFRADKNHTSLPPRVHQIVVLTVGTACQAAYELYMVMLTGLYLTVCAIVNAFEVPVPPGAQPDDVAGDGAK